MHYMARRVGSDEGDELAGEVRQWIDQHLRTDYAWPGNYRELEQCVKNVLIRRDYRPSGSAAAGVVEQFCEEVRDGRLTADELLSRYVTLAYRRTGSYEAAARVPGLDRRTVKAKVDERFLEKLEGGQPDVTRAPSA